jgi:UDP-GlcNAc:undecaprenyl-phosphate GlcNAc-1-phosphate transferase
VRWGGGWGLVDAPGGRRKHTGIIPRTGGLALFGGFFVTVLLITVLPDPLAGGRADWFPARNDPNEERPPGCTAGRLALLRRLWPARRPLQLPPGPQYLMQFGAALIAFAGLIFIKHVNDPFGEWLSSLGGWLSLVAGLCR